MTSSLLNPMVAVHRIAASGPDDVSGLERLVEAGELDPSGIVAILGMTDLFVSGGAEHQGPDGGGPVAIIAERR